MWAGRICDHREQWWKEAGSTRAGERTALCCHSEQEPRHLADAGTDCRKTYPRQRLNVQPGDSAKGRADTFLRVRRGALLEVRWPLGPETGRAIAYARTRSTVGSTKERKISLICSGVSRLRR